jgi:two-component system, OmpR family, sensor kinase
MATFWRLFISLWAVSVLAFGAAVGVLHFTGHRPPPEGALFPLLPIGLAALVSLIFSAGVAGFLSRSLGHLRWGLQRAAQERFETRVRPLMDSRSNEFVAVAHEFDRMAERLQLMQATRRTLLHDLSHELRSPLARMQAAIGLSRQDAEGARLLHERIEREVQRLDLLVEELLTLHRLESADDPAGERLATARVDLVELLVAITDDAGFEARATEGRSVELRSGGAAFVANVNGDLVYRAFENVIRNAVKYTAPGTPVEVEVRLPAHGKTLEVLVSDRGPGVPEDKLQAMFEPFVRLEGSESVRGTGLGLALARRAIVSHGGRIDARRRDGGGLTVCIQLPADGPQA